MFFAKLAGDLFSSSCASPGDLNDPWLAPAGLDIIRKPSYKNAIVSSKTFLEKLFFAQ